MKIKNAVFAVAFLSLLTLQNAFAGRIEDFTPEEQELIKKFYSVATDADADSKSKNKESAIQKAKEIIETVPQLIPNYGQTQFSINDLFTTTFEKKVYTFYSKECNFLLDYFYKPVKDNAFFDYILPHIPNIDALKDKEDRTLLMRLADTRPHDSTPGKGEINDEINIHCFKSLLRKGASLQLQDKEGHDALSIALLARNTPMINLILEHLEAHTDINLDEKSETLLEIHQGKFIDISLLEERLVKDIYRVANQSQNYQMVDALYTQLYKPQAEEIFLNAKEAYYFHPPLWAYNISQMKQYAVSIVKQLQEHVIDERKLQHIEGPYYTYKDGVQDLILRKKATDNIGRILGRNHMENVIQRLGFQDQVAVPRKFLTVPSGESHTIKIELKIPYESEKGEGLNMGFCYNPMGIEIKGATVYAEFIEGIDAPPGVSRLQLMNNDSMIIKIGNEAGFEDDAYGDDNFMKSTKDGRIYFIDTEDGKNFIQRKMDKFSNMTEVKSYCFDPRIRFIPLQLSEEDFK